LSQRIGGEGSLAALDLDAERLEEARELLRGVDLAAPVSLVAGDVFDPPFEPRTFDLVYSAGLFHELDVRERSAEGALVALISVTRPGGRIATDDFIDSVPAVQLEDEEFRRELVREVSGAELYGIGPPDRLIKLHAAVLDNVRWRILPPHNVRHLDRLVLEEGEPEACAHLLADARRRFQRRRKALLERVRREGYSRPATLYVEGLVTGDRPE